MGLLTEEVLGVLTDDQGNKYLHGQRFVDKTFAELVFGPVKTPGLDYVVEECKFINCQVRPGTYEVNDGVLLKNVLFDNVICGDMFTISSNAVLDRVIIRGGAKSRGLWIKPLEVLDPALDRAFRAWAAEETKHVSMMLDISEYRGWEVEILGLPIEKVVIDPNQHFVVTRKWHEVDWDRLGISRTSFWRITLMRLDDFEVETGIYTLPRKGERKFEQRMQELEKLKDIGLL